MGYSELKEKFESPKRASRRIGPMFQYWLSKKFNTVSNEKFEKSSTKGILFLSGKDKELKAYAISKLKCRFSKLTKGLDFIGRSKNKFIIGTSKFITDFGGGQDNQFYEAIRFIRETKTQQNIIKVAVMDGVIWLKGKSSKGRKTERTLENLEINEFCFSALLLKEFIEKI